MRGSKLKRYVVTCAGEAGLVERRIEALTSEEATRLACDTLRMWPVLVEPDMAHVARTQPFFADELLAAVWGVRP